MNIPVQELERKAAELKRREEELERRAAQGGGGQEGCRCDLHLSPRVFFSTGKQLAAGAEVLAMAAVFLPRYSR
jgi:hypothetical protein